MDAACLPALAQIGLAVLPDGLRDRLRRLEAGELGHLEAEAARAELDLLARLLRPGSGNSGEDPGG